MVSRVFSIKVWMEQGHLWNGYQDEKIKHELLEHLKNGRTLASKFDSKELKFHTPNIIVVFSNEKPDVGQMSKDRWKIFHIRDEDLLDATEKYV